MGLPFVGRDEELRRLGELAATARREGVAAAALITGEPGSGKSRLLHEALSHADPRRTVQLVGFEPTQAIPLAAAGDLFRRLVGVPDHGPRLQSLVFGSAGLVGQGALPAFEATYRALAAFGPLAIAIDDLQWVDAQSISLVHYVLRAAESSRSPLVVFAAGRPSPESAVFAQGIETSLPNARRASMDLTGLGADDGAALARAIEPELTPAAAERVWQRAAGSPFWIDALARGRESAGIGDVVAGRLRNLSADAAELLAILAVGARPFGRPDAAQLAGWPAGRTAHALAELHARGLVLEAGGAERLTHDLIREAVTRELPAPRQRELHGRLARHLESRAGADPKLLAEVLDHRSSAGLPTADLAIQLVESPQRRLLGREDVERLAAIADGLASTDTARARLDAGIGRLAAELAEPELAIRHWSRASTEAAAEGLRHRAHLEAARSAYVLRRAADAKSHLAKAEATASDPTRAVAVAALAADIALWLEPDTSGSTDKAIHAVQLAATLSESAGGIERLSPDAAAAVLSAYEAGADAAMREERRDDALRLTESALEMAEGLGEEARLAAVLRAAFRYRTFGLFELAERRYRDAWDTAHRLVLPLQVVDAGQGLARVLRFMARIHEAGAVAHEASEVERRIGVEWRQYGTMTMVLHSLELRRGEPGALAKLAKDADGMDPHAAIGIHTGLAVWLARQHGADRAADIVREVEAARAASAIARCPRCGRDALIDGAEALARIGRVDEARSDLAASKHALGEQANPVRKLQLRLVQTVLEAVADERRAIGSLTELASALETEGHVEDAITMWLDLGGLRHRLGDRAEAIEAYTRAAAMAEGGGEIVLQRLATRALRNLGVRAWRRGPGGPATAVDGLSRREREIAGLVAEGSTNRDIAEALALSPKTVERHVTNILAKVGARNRTELAGLMHASPRDAAGTGISR